MLINCCEVVMDMESTLKKKKLPGNNVRGWKR